MSGPVDVREVLDRRAAHAAQMGQGQMALELRDVHAAVVDLVEAAEEARQLLEMMLLIGGREAQPGSTGYKLRNAIANAGGGL